MVSQLVPSEFVFRILYKVPGLPEQRMAYSAQDLNTLLKMLNRTENISISSCERLIIHQTLPDNTVMEVLAHDIRDGTLMVNHTNKPSNVVEFRPLSRDEAIMQEVQRSLQAARESIKTPVVVTKKLVALKHKVTTGYNTFAYEARSGDEYE